MTQCLRVRLACCMCLSWMTLQAQTHPAPQSVAVVSHFQPVEGVAETSGSLDGWESYPVAEDAGYDPSLLPETRDGVSAIVREASPLRDGPMRLGFIRRIKGVSGEDSSVHARLSVPYATGLLTATLTVFRGSREENHSVQFAAGDTMQPLDFPLEADPATITAVALTVDLPHAIHGRAERVSMADLRIRILQTPVLPVTFPAVLWDAARSFFYVKRQVRVGETLHVQLGSSADWTLQDPSGRVAAHGHGAALTHTFEAAGLWHLHAGAADEESDTLLLVRTADAARVFFDAVPAVSPELLQQIRQRRDTLRKAVFMAGGRNIASMGQDFLLPGLIAYFNVLLQPAELAMLDAMDYRVSGNTQARDESVAALREMVSWPTWLHPWFPSHGFHSYYPMGLAAKYVVAAQQFLGDDLSMQDRRTLDAALLRLVIKPTYEEYVRQDRLQWDTSNWIGNMVGGALVAALASDDPDAAGYALGLFARERDHIRAAYTPDGSYGEGVTYHRFDLETSSLASEAARRILKQTIDQPMQHGERYLRYAAYGEKGQLLDFGDSHLDGRPSNVFAYNAARLPSDAMSRFYFASRDVTSAQLLPRVLWESQIPPPNANVTEELPAATLFSQRGVAVVRDGWSSNAMVVAMRAGKHFNHNHADQGSLLLAQKGHLWIGEAGYADYYKDPFYNTYNTQAIGHNTLLVDGDPESQALAGNSVYGQSPTTRHALIAETGSVVEVALAPVYRGLLSSYTRTLVHVPGSPLLILDRVRSPVAHRFTQVWHPGVGIASAASVDTVTLAEGSDQASIRAYATSPMTLHIMDAPLPLSEYEKSEQERVTRPRRVEYRLTDAERHATIITLIGDPSSVQASHFTRADSQWTVGAGGVSGWGDDTDGSLGVQWHLGLVFLHTQDGRTAAGKSIFTSRHPVDLRLALNADGKTLTIEVHAEAAGSLHLAGMPEVQFQPGVPFDVPCTDRIAACYVLR